MPDIETITVGPGNVATLLVSKSENAAHLITNLSLTTILYLGVNNGIKSTDNEVVPVNPNASVVVDGTLDIYGTATANIQVAVLQGGVASFLGLTQAQGQLAIPSIRSPNYLPGISGWSINQDGSAEFNNLTVRGNFVGPNYFISNGDGTYTNVPGIFLYDGTPAAGNLTFSATSATFGAGHDKFNNNFLSGDTSYDNGAKVACNRSFGTIGWFTFTVQPNAVFTSQGLAEFSSDLVSALPNNGVSLSGFLQLLPFGGQPETNLEVDANGLFLTRNNADTTYYRIGGGIFIRRNSNLRITTTPFTQIFAWPTVQAGPQYRVTVHLKLLCNVSVGNAVIGWGHGSSAVPSDFFSRAWYATTAGVNNYSNNTGAAFPVDLSSPTLVNTAIFAYELEGAIILSGTGNIALTAAETGGGDFYVLTGSYAELRRIA
jgi:hypothetical protein